jgi:hypothetical protein
MKAKFTFITASYLLMLGAAKAQQTFSFKPIAEVPLKFIKTTGKISNLPNLPEFHRAVLEKGPENLSLRKEIQFYEDNASPKGPDPAMQKLYNGITNDATASSVQVISNWSGITPGADPSDNTIAVGTSHIIQMVNGSGTPIRIYNKSTGAVLKNTSVQAITGTANIGDPNIVYDQRADRYVFLVIKSVLGGDLQICISKTNDPTGEYYLYQLLTGGLFANTFPDFPKLGVWNNSYFITTNSGGPYIYALDRQSMLAGTTARPSQKFTLTDFPGGGVQAASPVTLTGSTSASSKPIIIRAFDDAWTAANDVDGLELYTMTIDWSNSSNSSISGPLLLNTAAFDSKICNDFNSSSCIIQEGATKKLDALGAIISDKAQYRKFGTYESIVCCVFANAGNNTGAIRWYELRKSGTANWSVFQQGTYAPADGQNRFIGSISQNNAGSIALGYNISGTTEFPGQRVTGRVLSDGSGNLTAPETIVKAGSVAKTSSNRYGDYNAMVCDPTDGSFWFTANYNPTASPETNIVHFQINNALAVSFADAASVKISGNSLSIVPNPANSYADIIYHSDKAVQVPVQLVNIEGKVFAEKLFSCNKGENKLRLDLSNIPKGYYLVKLHATRGTIMEKLFVQK